MKEKKEIWRKTMQLRWENRINGKGNVYSILQQLWKSDKGKIEWHDIDIIKAK